MSVMGFTFYFAIFAPVIGYNLKVCIKQIFLNKKETTLWQKFINFIDKF